MSRFDDHVHPWRVPLLVRIVRLTLVALVAVYLVSLLVRDTAGYDLVFEGVITVLALGLAAVLCLMRALLRREDRGVFALIGFGCLAYTAGNVAYVSHVQYLDPMPFPSAADIGWLGIYPFLVVAVILLGRSEVAGTQVGVWLDGLVGVLGVAAAGSALVLQTTLKNLSGDFTVLFVGAAYPLGDLLVLSMIVGVLTVRGRRPDRKWMALTCGLLVFVLADIIYMVRLSTDSYVQGTFLDALWMIGLALVSLSAWQPPTRHRIEEPAAGLGSLAVTIAASLSAVAVLVAASTVETPSYAVGLAGATLLAASARTVVAFHQLRHLVEARQLAGTDDLTGLSNRRAFTAFLDRTLETASPDRGFAVLLLDLDRFKEVNDLFGHQVGDRLLQEIGPRLSPILRPGDMLSRLGGDEFGFVLPGTDETAALQIGRRLCDALSPPFVLDDVASQITGSIGVALWPADSDNSEELFQCADVAMYTAKSHRSGVELYDVEHDADGRDRLAMAKQLRLAAEADQFVLHYQPKIDLRSGRLIGVEALVRWQHPEHGLLYPDVFVPIAEQTGTIRALTTKVLSTAIAQCGQWRLDGFVLTVAVNLSSSDLLSVHLVNDIALMLTRSRVPADLLQLEITETTLMLEPERAVATLHALHALGVTLSVDDYGTGFSSLSYLRDLPVQELKIDRTFITKLTEHSRDSAIVRSTVDLAHSLGIEVVAEGVENGDVMTLVRSFGCDLAQGYHICKPKPANELTAWLRTQPTQTDDTLFASITCADSSHALSPCSVLPAQPSVDDASPTLARS